MYYVITESVLREFADRPSSIIRRIIYLILVSDIFFVFVLDIQNMTSVYMEKTIWNSRGIKGNAEKYIT